MSLNFRQAHQLAAYMLDDLTRDTRALSAAVATLDDLASVEDWTACHEARFTTALETIADLTDRYRSGRSILNLTGEPRATRSERTIMSNSRAILHCSHDGCENTYGVEDSDALDATAFCSRECEQQEYEAGGEPRPSCGDGRPPAARAQCCLNNDTGCYDAHCSCPCSACAAVRAAVRRAANEPTPGPWQWERVNLTGTWQAFLRSTAPIESLPHRDSLVTAMREDLAAFPYAIDTPDARLLAKAWELRDVLARLLHAYDHKNMVPTDAVVSHWHRVRALLAEIDGRERP